MLTFQGFILELYSNEIDKTGQAKWSTAPSAKQKRSYHFDDEKVIGKIGRHKVTHQKHIYKNSGFIENHYQVRGSLLGLGKISLTTTQHLKRKDGKISDKLDNPLEHKEDLLQGVKHRFHSKVKAVDLYHHLITQHGITLRGSNHSPGAQKTWHRLLQRPDVNMHLGKRKLKPDMSFDDFQKLYTSKSFGKDLIASRKK